MSAQLPWVKLHTKILASPKWRSLPAIDRCVFLHLVALAGASGTRGFIEGTDAQIADAIAMTTREVRAALRRLDVERVEGGLQITKWDEYQPAMRGLSHAQRGKPATGGVAVGVARVDKRREDQTRGVVAVLESLERLPGWQRDDSRDIELVEELAKRYPSVDLVASLAGLRDWLEDGGQTGNLRNTVRNRVAKSFEFGRDLKSSRPHDETADEIRERLQVLA
jgi:hypothetical protein